MTYYESKCVCPIAPESVINICISLQPLSNSYYHIHNARLDCCGIAFDSLRSWSRCDSGAQASTRAPSMST